MAAEAVSAGFSLLDILEFAKELAPQATPGLYIALATDEDSDSEDGDLHYPQLLRSTVATDLDASACIVFIDPGVTDYWEDNRHVWLVPGYYDILAVNGGAVEQESGNLGTFTFQHMRQKIAGTP